ncbi:hypothetical protein [Paraburkholderia sp. J10-1]|uniref:hypothetical protein n=1 Tax=Paraburkholderia sp. J10-1 TaxID=2805430 RepID=UPI002AB77A85|nr:hypothetical protein [Paraburkholderia sp. J10-1]
MEQQMEDKDDEAKRIAKLTEFFGERGVKEICDACGHLDWTVAPMTSLFALTMFPVPRLGGKDGSVLDGRHFQPVIVTACQNCGFVRLFSGTVYSQWQAQKVMEEGDGV